MRTRWAILCRKPYQMACAWCWPASSTTRVVVLTVALRCCTICGLATRSGPTISCRAWRMLEARGCAVVSRGAQQRGRYLYPVRSSGAAVLAVFLLGWNCTAQPNIGRATTRPSRLQDCCCACRGLGVADRTRVNRRNEGPRP